MTPPNAPPIAAPATAPMGPAEAPASAPITEPLAAPTPTPARCSSGFSYDCESDFVSVMAAPRDVKSDEDGSVAATRGRFREDAPDHAIDRGTRVDGHDLRRQSVLRPGREDLAGERGADRFDPLKIERHFLRPGTPIDDARGFRARHQTIAVGGKGV